MPHPHLADTVEHALALLDDNADFDEARDDAADFPHAHYDEAVIVLRQLRDRLAGHGDYSTDQPPLLHSIDYPLLASQKATLVDRDDDTSLGLLHLIDAVQDAAIDRFGQATVLPHLKYGA